MLTQMLQFDPMLPWKVSQKILRRYTSIFSNTSLFCQRALCKCYFKVECLMSVAQPRHQISSCLAFNSLPKHVYLFVPQNWFSRNTCMLQGDAARHHVFGPFTAWSRLDLLDWMQIRFSACDFLWWYNGNQIKHWWFTFNFEKRIANSLSVLDSVVSLFRLKPTKSDK